MAVVGLALSGLGLAQAQFQNYRPVTDEMVLKPDPGDWLNWRRTLDLWGYSPLNQVTRFNVTALELAWVFPMAAPGLQELAPLVHDGIMFFSTNNNIVQAVDAVTGDQIWRFTPKLEEIKGGYHTNQARRQKNSISLYKDKVYLATVDAKIYALEAKTGKVVWQKQVLDWRKGYSYTTGPFVYKNKIVSGTSGCSITGTAGGCFIMAHDAETGEELWRVNTLADSSSPAEVQASWNGVPQESRWGSTPWTTGSYDPETNLTYWGTGMPIPYPEIIRGSKDGNVLYTNSTLAINLDTGKLQWYFQHHPRDNWDLDHPFERLVVNTKIGGKDTKTLLSIPGKTGIVWSLDRTTGKYLWSKETVYQNTVKGIDAAGKVALNLDLIPKTEGQEVLFCPAISGGKLWQAIAYSPQTNAIYAPLNETCQTLRPRTVDFLPGEAVGGISSTPRQISPGQDKVGAVFSVDASTGKINWTYRQKVAISSSTLTTAGGIVFVGDMARYFMALDQRTGQVLWRTRLNAPIGGYPMSYSVNGTQYIAVPVGDNTHANSAALYPEVPLVSGSNSLYVFKLRGR